MDILKRQLLKENDVCYFMQTSYDDSFMLYRFKGRIAEVKYAREDAIIYRVTVDEILETDTFIKDNLDRKRFRGVSKKGRQIHAKRFFVFDLDIPSIEMKDRLENWLMECPSPFVFSDRNEMEKKYKDAIFHMVDKVSKERERLMTRYKSLK